MEHGQAQQQAILARPPTRPGSARAAAPLQSVVNPMAGQSPLLRAGSPSMEERMTTAPASTQMITEPHAPTSSSFGGA